MKSILMSMFLMLFVSLASFAGQVYGSLSENGQPVSDIVIEISCGGRTFAGRTDKDGSYRIYVGERGRATFKITYKNQPVISEIYSYQNPVRYDFGLELDQQGHYGLRRK